ncbi:hypothetical protein CAPTEDRAFT_229047 [Capitella teleta]|uniref:Uncharacterized protein n=1 Tax=Capitella teleta TaxID=283909 RepID=R7UHF2_CAPTE|nr:hypothetical protein CAPTEDRAFT_229047 [Capitella teleta]|eukprot:ELU05513.1 hypothetical protein CAPTEDRAFT_229047 [Capitella teleta]
MNNQLNTLNMSGSFPPIFKEKIKDQAYHVGDSCSLRVHVIGNPRPTVSWYRNEELLTDGGRVRTTKGDDGRHTITILSTKPNDFGVYKCVARNRFGTVTCRARMLCGDHPTRPGRPHVTKISDREAFMIWEEPDSDGNSHILAYKLDWHRPGDERWTTATYCIDECALIKGLKVDTSYRFRVSAVNAFGISPYSWASVEIRTKKKGASAIDIDDETKRILLRSRQATHAPSPDSSPAASPHGSTENIAQACEEETPKKDELLREVHLQEIDPANFLEFANEVWRGRFTLIRNVKPKSGKKVKRVAKIIPNSSEDALREYEMLKDIRQQRIIRLHEAYLWNDFVFLVSEKLYGENVARSMSLKNKYNEHQVSSIVKQVLDALQFLHHRGIVHLNLQPDNVIMQSRRRLDIKLIDFGRARKISNYDGEKIDRDGTAEFMAPEKVQRDPVGVPADIWGVGVFTFILLSGVSPFRGETDQETFSNITHVRYDAHSLYHNVTKYALKFLYQILKRNAKSRLTTDECLDHRWFQLNAPMIKVRKSAVFSTDKLKTFEEDYIKRRMVGSSPPDALLRAYGAGLSFSSDEEEEETWATRRFSLANP